jgi:hypothetical protein
MSRKPRGSRKGDIPGGLILRWQNSAAQPVIRRPLTACQMCRIAKVKCNGKQDCDRCTSRGLVCRYKETDKRDTQAPLNDTALSTAATQSTPEDALLNLDSPSALDHYSTSTTVYNGDRIVDPMADWPTQQMLGNLDWEIVDPTFSVRSLINLSDMVLLLIPFLKENTINAFYNLPMLPDINTPPSAISSSRQDFVASNPLSHINVVDAATTTPNNGLAQPDINQLSSLPRCQCRERLAGLIPQVNRAMQGKQFNQVFQGTQQVVDGFQGTVDCRDCNITCTELICIMSMFQQTDSYFDYIARADTWSAMDMSFGGSQVPINDPKLRAMLVISLIHQATLVLDAIRSKGQHMIQALCPPSALARTNIAYLDSAISDFRTTLGVIADTANKTGLQTT